MGREVELAALFGAARLPHDRWPNPAELADELIWWRFFGYSDFVVQLGFDRSDVHLERGFKFF